MNVNHAVRGIGGWLQEFHSLQPSDVHSITGTPGVCKGGATNVKVGAMRFAYYALQRLNPLIQINFSGIRRGQYTFPRCAALCGEDRTVARAELAGR